MEGAGASGFVAVPRLVEVDDLVFDDQRSLEHEDIETGILVRIAYIRHIFSLGVIIAVTIWTIRIGDASSK